VHEDGDSGHVGPKTAFGGLRARLERDSTSQPDTQSRGAAEPGTDPPGRRPEMTIGEPLTPELALVDPELARRARERLPRHALEPRPFAVRHEAPARAPTVAHEAPAPAPPVRVARSTASARPLDSQVAPRKRRRRRAIILSIVVGAAATVAVVRVPPLRHFFWESTEPTFSPTVRQSSARVPLGHTAATPTPRRPVYSSTEASIRSQPSVTGKSRAAPRAVAGSHRAFAWVPVPKATYYLVQFYRGRKEIFEARPSTARLLLPREWAFKGRRYRLGPGRYRWSVRPGFGRPSRARYGRPIVAAELVVPAASVR
jgi:hypothetical protein